MPAINNDVHTSVQSVERALDILECVAGRHEPMRSTDIALALGLHKNTAHNLIRTLFRRNYLDQLPDSRYVVGQQLYQIVSQTDRWETLRGVALPIMQELSRDTKDCAFLGVLDSGRLRCVALAEGTGAIRIALRQDWEDLLHCTAAGKVILAWNGVALETLLSRPDALTRQASKTITDPSALRENLKQAFAQGYVLVRDESSEHVSSLGVPILLPEGKLVGALAQSFPSFHLDAGLIDLGVRVGRLSQDAALIAQKLSSRNESI